MYTKGYRPYDSGVDDAMEFPYQRHGEVEAEEHVITVTINSEVQNLTSNGVRAGRKKEVTFRVQGQVCTRRRGHPMYK